MTPKPSVFRRMVATLAVAAMAGAALLIAVGTGGGAPAGASGATTTVHIAGFAFGPGTVTVHVGDSVTWVNDDDADHSVTADDGSFNSNPGCPGTCMGKGATYHHTFNKAGTYTYHCAVHGPSMSGTVVVLAATTTSTRPVVSSTSPTGATTTIPAPAGAAPGLAATPHLTG